MDSDSSGRLIPTVSVEGRDKVSRTIPLTALFAVPVLAAAVLPQKITMQPGSRVWVDGSSTTSFWHCESSEPRGSARVRTIDLGRIGEVTRVEVVVPLATLRCRNETMDRHMQAALKAYTAPEIRFRARSLHVAAKPDSGWAATIDGRLSVAGESREIRVQATVTEEGGRLRVRGSRRLRMTDWGIARPTVMREVEVAPEVTVGFDVLLAP